MEIRLQFSTALIIEHRALDNAVGKGSAIVSETQCQGAATVSETWLDFAESSQLGTMDGARLTRDGSNVDLAPGKGKINRWHLAHGMSCSKAHFNMVAIAGSVGAASATVAAKSERSAAHCCRNGASGGSGTGLDVINRAIGERSVKIGGALFRKGDRIVDTKIRVGWNWQNRSGRGNDRRRKISLVKQTGQSARRLHCDHSVLASENGGRAAGSDGHRESRPVAGA